MRRKPLNGRWGPLETILANPKGAGRMLSATPVVDQRTKKIHLFVRDGSATNFDESFSRVLTSTDLSGGGWTETARYPWVTRPGPSHGIQLARGEHLDRHRMVIRSSYNEGRTWQGVNDSDSQTIHTGPASYTSMAMLSDGRIGLAFEAGDEGQVSHYEVRYTTFSEEDLGLPDSYSGGTPTADASGLGNTARIRGTGLSADGRFTGGMTLDGVDDHVQVPFAESLAVDDADFTVMAWVKYSATTGNRPIFWAYNDGTWHLVAFQRQGTTLRLFVDGTLAGTGTGPTGTVSPGRPFQMDIGQRIDGAQHFAGSLDEVRLYRRALTEAEIDRIHATNAGDVPGARLRLPFDPI